MKSRDSFLVNTMFGNDDGAEVDSRLRGMQFVKFWGKHLSRSHLFGSALFPPWLSFGFPVTAEAMRGPAAAIPRPLKTTRETRRDIRVNEQERDREREEDKSLNQLKSSIFSAGQWDWVQISGPQKTCGVIQIHNLSLGKVRGRVDIINPLLEQGLFLFCSKLKEPQRGFRIALIYQ